MAPPQNTSNPALQETYTARDMFSRAQAVGMHTLNPLSTRYVDIRDHFAEMVEAELPLYSKVLETELPQVVEELNTEVSAVGQSVETALPVGSNLRSGSNVGWTPSEKTPRHEALEFSRRRLLQASIEVQRYSTLTAATGGFSNIPLSSSLADNWLEGPFGWPPKLDSAYFDADHPCVAAQVSVDVFSECGQVMKMFFSEYNQRINDGKPWGAQPEALTWGVMENLPATYGGVYSNAS
jgi:hypothetical protein